MHIKHMHEMIEKLVDCTKAAIENDETCVGQYPIGDVVDMIKDLNEAEYYAHISKAMDEEKEEEKEEEKYMLKRFKEEYGEEDGERRYYDDYRYMRTGRFAPKGRGTYTGRSRRGYSEMMPMYDMMPEMYRDDSEWNRDMDRPMGRMYYSGGGNSSNSNMGNMSGNRSNSNNDGSDGRRNYDGDGRSGGRRNNSGDVRDYREGRSGQRRRGYMETKEIHSDNTPESKQHRMKELDEYMKSLSEDVTEMIGDASAEERALLKQKMQGLVSKL